MVGISLVLAGALSLGAPPHLQSNPVFNELVTGGVSPGGDEFFPVPAPVMADGLDAAAQRKTVSNIARPSYTYERFTQNSTVAPQVLKIEELKGSPGSPMWGVDLYFVAYGNMNAMINRNFLGNAFQANNQQGAQGFTFTPEQLAERRIVIQPENQEYESYSQSVIDLMNKVELSVVTRAFWSRTKESIVTAAALDPRFNADPQFPNVWRELKRTPAGAIMKGPPQPYQGLGMYMKITQLAQPQGALFVEAHAVYHEPQGWFGGQALLRSKIRAATGQKVKEMRQEMLKAGR